MKLTLCILLLAALAVAQTTTPVKLSWTAPALVLTVGGGPSVAITYNVYRSAGVCPASVAKPYPTPIASNVAATTYQDSLTAPGAYYYWVTDVFAGAESLPSNLAPYVLAAPPPTGLTAQ